MSFNPTASADCSLEVFGGWVTETDPTSLPPGVSPECPGCSFVPGSVFTRAGLQAIFNPPLAPNSTITYGKSFVANDGTIYNLYLASNGTLYLENITTSPGTATALFATFQNLYARSVTAFGREFIAISDGLHGADVPLQFDGTNLDRVTCDGPGMAPVITLQRIAQKTIGSLTIASNLATVTTTPHPPDVQVGWQVKIQGAGVIPTPISTIVLNNGENPGIATVTTVGAHTLKPGNSVTIGNVGPASIGTISSIVRQGQVVTVVTPGTQVVTPGTVVTIAGVTDATFDGTFAVAYSPAAGTFVYFQADVDGSSSGGTATIPWPVPADTPTPTYFEILNTPSSTTFTIQLTAPDATWNGGSADFSFDGTFYVSATTPTSFEYQISGPDGTSHTGTMQPYGQISPGDHLCRISFETRQGYVTKPSPWVKFTASGGEFVLPQSMVTGPAYVTKRILEFTGSGGSLFCYIPVPSQVNGQVVSTSTVINDNTTVNSLSLIDFSDNSLFAGLGTSIPGNNTPAQIVLDGALGFASYESYLITWGQRNTVTNLLNLGFDGGVAPTTGLPAGWQGGGAGYSIVNSPRGSGLGTALLATATTTLVQDAYQDAYGAPILVENTLYGFRAYLKGSGTLKVSLISVSASFTASVTLIATTAGGFVQGTLSAATPATIPSDIQIQLHASPGIPLYVDEGALYFASDPYTDNTLNVSYANNQEAFDGVTGKTGPATDPNQVMDFATIAGIPYILTREPSGRLHEIAATGTGLPASWQVNERAANCGVLSAFCLTKSQADDNSASGGEEWFAWASESGARIFGGNQPWKISQEIQPDWNDSDQEQSLHEINLSYAWTTQSVNDPVARVLYFFLPLGVSTTPSAVYTMNYRELDTAEQIAFSPPYRTGFSGKLIATDNTRKWSPWFLLMAGGARMFRTPAYLETVLFAGGVTEPYKGYGNVYLLNPNKYTDDDYGMIGSHYVTCSLPSKDQEQQLQLGAWRKLLTYLGGLISGVGNVVITPYLEALSNPWPLTCTRQLSADPHINLEYGGGNCEGYRMFFKIQAQALDGQTDQAFNLSRFAASFRTSRIKVRGAAQ